MKEMIGTITLAYVEEDNKQRVIFRIIPLCTKEGHAFHGSPKDFPDTGCMRIVPDKREQSTFKDRMHDIGGFCVIQLPSNGKEAMKVRQNRNYAPEQGESNQFALYSDVVCEFLKDGCYEVIEKGKDRNSALTERILIRADKMLYGPVDATSDIPVDELKPFGNEAYLLHTVDAEQIGEHQICWNPEAIMTWSQRRNALRKRDKANAEPVAEPQEVSEKQDVVPSKKESRFSKTEKQSKQKKPESQKTVTEEEPKATKKQQKPDPIPVAEQMTEDQSLPIGQHLDILDSDVTFEQHLSNLAQPLSDNANRLTTTETEELPSDDTIVETAHFSGNPLVQKKSFVTEYKTEPENVHHVVDRQVRARYEAQSRDTSDSVYHLLDNPVELVRNTISDVWDYPEIRQQILNELLDNGDFVRSFTSSLQKKGINVQALSAAQEVLSQIEAERISLILQLEEAQSTDRRVREEFVRSLTQKKRDELERIKTETKRAHEREKAARKAYETLSNENAKKTRDFVTTEMTEIGILTSDSVVISPVIGNEYSISELTENLRVHLNESGYSYSADEAFALLLSFAQNDTICICSKTVEDASAFAEVFLESIGLQSVSASIVDNSKVSVLSILPETPDRSPTITIQKAGTERLSLYGHKTIYLADPSYSFADESIHLYPVISIPDSVRSRFVKKTEWEQRTPVALSSFADEKFDQYQLLNESEKWISDARKTVKEAGYQVSSVLFDRIRSSIKASAKTIHGGFIGAADFAVRYWLLPVLGDTAGNNEEIVKLCSGLPRTLEQITK